MNKLIQYLEDRGVNTNNLDQLGIELAGPERIREVMGRKPSFDKRCGLIFHYPGYDYATCILEDGTKLCRKHNKTTDKPHCYKPNLLDWDRIEGTLVITESHTKAIVLCQLGYQAVCGTGVDSLYTSKGFATGFPHSALESGAITTVLIAFDNDCWGGENHTVEGAVRRLYRGLADRHPNTKVQMVQLGNPPQDWRPHKAKRVWGWDDVFMYGGADLVHEYMCEYISEISGDALQDQFDELNAQYTVCFHPPCVVELESGRQYSDSHFRNIVEASRIVPVPKANGELKPLEVAKAWLKWEGRNVVDRYEYMPGKPEYVLGEYYNPWREGEVGRREGDISPFLKIYENAIPEEAEREQLWDCIAYMLQNREERLPKSLFLVGRKEGTGKTWLCELVGKLLGVGNYTVAGEEELQCSFNEGLVQRELVVLDEVQGLGKASFAKLKRLITANHVHVTAKGLRPWEQKNVSVYFMTANEIDAVPISDNDRRMGVCMFEPKEHIVGGKWWKEYAQWLAQGGEEIVHEWFMDRDLSEFDPNFMPVKTAGKERVAQAATDDMEQWCRDICTLGVKDVINSPRVCWNFEECMALFTQSGEALNNKEKERLKRLLSKYFVPAHGGKNIKVVGSCPRRYWVLEEPNGKVWTPAEVRLDIKKDKSHEI